MFCEMLIIVELISPCHSDYATGYLSQYAPGVMDYVIEKRIEWGHINLENKDYDGFVAVSNCDLIGEEVLIRPSDSAEWETFLIVDCAGNDGTVEWMETNNILAEVDYETAVRYGFFNEGGFRCHVVGLN